VVLGAVVVVLLIVAGIAALAGVNPLDNGRDSTRPPCAQLPDRQAVDDALASHQDLVTRIEAVGSDVEVGVATPCDEPPDRAIIRITYQSDDEWDGIQAILTQEGFGVAVEVVED
jgi:hypothetical protein